jgi:hypothetical protein
MKIKMKKCFLFSYMNLKKNERLFFSHFPMTILFRSKTIFRSIKFLNYWIFFFNIGGNFLIPLFLIEKIYDNQIIIFHKNDP